MMTCVHFSAFNFSFRFYAEATAMSAMSEGEVGRAWQLLLATS
jgi:hypothetical protein